MATAETILEEQKITRPADTLDWKRFRIRDHQLVDRYVQDFSPRSCEYNFANLYSWQNVYDISWTLYQGRLLIYDGLSRMAFMPLGTDFSPEDLVVVSLYLLRDGRSPDFGLVTGDYLEKHPDIEEYYQVEQQRNAAEYIYDVNQLVALSGTKLQKKKNLITQFKRYYPDYRILPMTPDLRRDALEFSKNLLNRGKKRSRALDQEFTAIRTALANFDALHLDGMVATLDDTIIAYSVFSRISSSTYDIQFEKADPQFKGAAQLINHETAKYLQDKCGFVNREQDLGIKGLRQAKLSYDPAELLIPSRLTFNLPN